MNVYWFLVGFFLIIAVIAIAGAIIGEQPSDFPQVPNQVNVFCDTQAQVACWLYSDNAYKGGISCLPYSQVSNIESTCQRQGE